MTITNDNDTKIITPAVRISYAASVPPEGTRCGFPQCPVVASVRLLVPAARTATREPEDQDVCGHHYTQVCTVIRDNGDSLTDATGDLDTIRGEFPDVNIVRSTGERLYATDAQQSYTAWLAGPLTAQLRARAAQTPGRS
jgi:hypothetical protein